MVPDSEDEQSADEVIDPSAITTEASFRAALEALLREAAENDVDVTGSWPIEPDATDAAWDLEITTLVRRSTAHLDGADGPTAAIVSAVAAREGVDPLTLPPLADAVETAVLESVHRAPADSGQSVTVDYCGYTITLDADGTLTVDE